MNYDAIALRGIPHHRVVQFHLAGHTNCHTHLIDTHDGPVISPVWELYREAWKLTGGVATLLEWDANIPPLPEVHAEILKARHFVQGNLSAAPEAAAQATASTQRLAISNPLGMVTAEVE